MESFIRGRPCAADMQCCDVNIKGLIFSIIMEAASVFKRKCLGSLD